MQLALRKKAYHQLGAAAVEYGLTLAVVVSLVMGGARLMESPLTQAFRCSAEKIVVAVNGGETSCGGSQFEIVTEISEGGEIYIAPPEPPNRVSPENLELTDAIVDIVEHEGYSDTIYTDIAGYPTIGYGHKLLDGEAEKFKDGITKEEAAELLKQDAQIAASAIKRLVQVPLTQGEYDALVSFTFNMGEGNFANSTLLKKLNQGDYAGAADEFPKWNKYKENGVYKESNGLTNRRKKERCLFLGGAC